MITILLFVVGVYGAALPQSCLQKCLEKGAAVATADDLRNFASIVGDIDNFCSLHSEVMKCGRECPESEVMDLVKNTAAATFICVEKIEEFRLAGKCVSSDGTKAINACLMSCGVSQDMTTAFRLDSNPASPINPGVMVDAMGPSCKNHLCAVKCSARDLTDKCPGSGMLFKELARSQLLRGLAMLKEQSSNANSSAVSETAQNYLQSLPADCTFLTDVDLFDKLTSDVKVEDVTAPVDLTGEMADDRAPPAIQPDMSKPADTESTNNEEIVKMRGGAESIEAEEMEREGEEKPLNDSDEVVASVAPKDSEKVKEEFVRDVQPETHALEFSPEDDFVPFGRPSNATVMEEVTENPAVAQPEEDVKLANQGTIPKTPSESTDAEDAEKKAEETEGTAAVEKTGEEEKKESNEETSEKDEEPILAMSEDENVTTAVSDEIAAAKEADKEEMQKDLPAVTTESSEESKLIVSDDGDEESDAPTAEEVEMAPIKAENTSIMSKLANDGESEAEDKADEEEEEEESEDDMGMDNLEESMKHLIDEATTEPVIVVDDGVTDEPMNDNEVVTEQAEMSVKSASSIAVLLAAAFAFVIAL